MGQLPPQTLIGGSDHRPLKTQPGPHSLNLLSLRFSILEKGMLQIHYFTGLLSQLEGKKVGGAFLKGKVLHRVEMSDKTQDTRLNLNFSKTMNWFLV